MEHAVIPAATDMPLYLSIEIGGTKQQAAVGTADGTILVRRQVRLGENTNASAILRWIRKPAQRSVRRTTSRASALASAAPSTPSPERSSVRFR